MHRPSTIARRLIGIGHAHEQAGHSDPSKDTLVRAILRGVKRQLGTAQRRAEPLLLRDLEAVQRVMPAGLRARRNRALLLVGFAAALRRSELVGLDVADLLF